MDRGTFTCLVGFSHLTFFLSCETGWGCLQIALSPSLLGTNMLICPMEMRILGNPFAAKIIQQPDYAYMAIL